MSQNWKVCQLSVSHLLIPPFSKVCNCLPPSLSAIYICYWVSMFQMSPTCKVFTRESHSKRMSHPLYLCTDVTPHFKSAIVQYLYLTGMFPTQTFMKIFWDFAKVFALCLKFQRQKYFPEAEIMSEWSTSSKTAARSESRRLSSPSR